jgi:AcrR family transcriptional regulator
VLGWAGVPSSFSDKPRVKSRRRYGPENSAVRAQLLDAAEQLMLEGGYASVTSRRLAAKIGVKQPLVYYYFRTMDELFLAVFRRLSEQGLSRLQAALASARPLRALWNLDSDRSRTALTMEFLALANHRKVVQAAIATVAEQFRSVEVDALTRLFEQRGITPQIPPVVVSVLLTAVARGLVQEDALGINLGHAPTLDLVETCQRLFEDGQLVRLVAAKDSGPPARPPQAPRRSSRPPPSRQAATARRAPR